ncbi:hypothetical protein BCR44DRAFT_1431772, partial [Catenaria anguillulae PL171]
SRASRWPHLSSTTARLSAFCFLTSGTTSISTTLPCNHFCFRKDNTLHNIYKHDGRVHCPLHRPRSRRHHCPPPGRAKSSYHIGARLVTLTLAKADTDAPWWPRLLADKRKPSWLKVDFARWKDEDEDDEEEQQGMGMPGTMDMSSGMGLNGGFDMSQFNIDTPDIDDSDDEEMPELEDDAAEEEEDKDSMEIVD